MESRHPALRHVQSFILQAAPGPGPVFFTLNGEKRHQPCEFVLGDAQDLAKDAFLGHGVHVRVDDLTGGVILTSSLSGLPAVYKLDLDGEITLASSVKPLLERSGDRRHFDPITLRALVEWGRPAPGRTLFEGIRPVPPGTRLLLEPSGRIRELDRFVAASASTLNREDYVESQCVAFRAAVGRLDLESTVLSLTAGLDTRAILAALSERERWIDAATICGEDLSIDARRAGELAQKYGFEHHVVVLDQEYRRTLPELCRAASLASQGIASFGETADLHFYRQLGSRYRKRLSGFLGNQIGRSGSEGISARGASAAVLDSKILEPERDCDDSHWMVRAAGEKELLDPTFQIQTESLCSSIANYSVGSSAYTQISPYADRTLIEQKISCRHEIRAASLRVMRLRDLHHRFLGQPVDQSFQRRVVADAGGPVDDVPINWGWRARGGMSVRGTLLGIRGFADCALGLAGRKIIGANSLRSALAVDQLAEFDRTRHLFQDPMPEFVRDTLSTRSLRGAGIFDTYTLDTIVDEGFRNRNHASTITFALDVALAWENFISSVESDSPD